MIKSAMRVTVQKDDRIKVKQFITDTHGHKMAAVIDDLIPASETWLYKNKNVLESVQRGLKQAAKGKIKKLAITPHP